MRKHKNLRQEQIFLQFMKKNQDIARGINKGCKLNFNQRWTDLAQKLNSEGPPEKDVSVWKKVWFDWKNNIKKKCVQNKREIEKSDDETRNVVTLTYIEEDIVKLLGLNYFISNNCNININDNSVDFSSMFERKNEKTQRDKSKLEENSSGVENCLDVQIETCKDVNEKLSKIVNNKKLRKYTKKICHESKKHNKIIESIMIEELKLKKRRTEIEEIKLIPTYY